MVREPALREPCGAAARREAGVDPADGHGGAVYDRVAARAVGAGSPRRDRPGRHRPFALSPRPVAADAHRRAACAAEPDPPVAQGVPEPEIRHELRPERVHRPRLRPPRARPHRQGRRDRQGRMALEDARRRRAGPRRDARRDRRAGRAGPRRDALLL